MNIHGIIKDYIIYGIGYAAPDFKILEYQIVLFYYACFVSQLASDRECH